MPRSERGRWPIATRQRAETLAAEGGLSVAETRQRLKAEGVDVPTETVRAWLRSPAALPADPQTLRDRVYRLAARELGRLERTPVGKADLRRLEALTRILRSADSDRPTKTQAAGLRRFADLAEENGQPTTSDEPFGLRP